MDRYAIKPYTELITRKDPTFFLFLVDQSGSMSEDFAGQPQRKKADFIADAINRLVLNLVLRSSRGTEIADYYYIGLIGYNSTINPGFAGNLKGKYQVRVSEVECNPLRIEDRIRKVEDGMGGIIEQKSKHRVWLDAVAKGQTKMREALEFAKDTVADFVQSFPRSFPPIVFNITDGVPTDATKPDLAIPNSPFYPEVEVAAKALREVANANGSQALLFNMHVSKEVAHPILFPSQEKMLPDRYSRLLFRMSSPLTGEMLRMANAAGEEYASGARGFVFQGDAVSIINLLNIGTGVGIQGDRNRS